MFLQPKAPKKSEWNRSYRFLRTQSLFSNAFSTNDYIVALLVLFLPSCKGFDTINTPGKIGVTIVGSAAEYGNWALVERLLDGGASVTGKGHSNQSLLYFAFEQRNPEAVKFILDHSAKSISRLLGKTAEHGWQEADFSLATKCGDQTILQILLDYWPYRQRLNMG